MLRYINSLATIEQNLKVKAIDVQFKGDGLKRDYFATLDMATELAVLKRAGGYLLRKEQFEDIDVPTFYEYIHHWLQRLDKQFNRGRGAKVRVALLVPKDCFLELSAVMHHASSWPLTTSLYHVACEVFYTADKATQYLQQHGTVPVPSQQRKAIPLHQHKAVSSTKL